MEHRIVLNQDVLAGSGSHTRLARTGLHADTVITSINRVVDNQHVFATADVEGITILGIPRAADGHTIYHHLSAAGRYQMKLG